MKELKIFFFFLVTCAFSSPLNATSWSLNSVWKIRAVDSDKTLPFTDYENIQNKGYYFSTMTNGSCWARTPMISIGDNYVLDSLFAHFDGPSNGSLTLTVRDAADDRVLSRQILSHTGALSVHNLFRKNIYLTLSFDNPDLKLYAFGLTRIEEKVMTSADLTLRPNTLFYDSTPLTLKFRLRFPALVDVAIFDMNGRIVQYLEKTHFLKEGNYTLTWNPINNKTLTKASGIYTVYIKSLSSDGKKTELSKSFWFVYK